MSVRSSDNDGCAYFTNKTTECLQKYKFDKAMCKQQFEDWKECKRVFVRPKTQKKQHSLSLLFFTSSSYPLLLEKTKLLWKKEQKISSAEKSSSFISVINTWKDVIPERETD